MSRRVLIVGIGRPGFGDDALGLVAAERLGERGERENGGRGERAGRRTPVASFTPSPLHPFTPSPSHPPAPQTWGESVRLVRDGGSGWGALHSLEGEHLLVLVDAAEAGPALPAGRWVRLRYPEDAPALETCALRDTHTLSVASLLAMGAALGELPPETWIYALAGERFAPETGLSPPVAASLLGMVDAITRDVREWLAEA